MSRIHHLLGMVGGLTRIITHEMFVFGLFLVSAESVAKGTLALSLLPVSFLSVSLSVFLYLSASLPLSLAPSPSQTRKYLRSFALARCSREY